MICIFAFVGTVEVLKVMYELGIKPTLHTYTNYVLTHTDVQTLSALLQVSLND